MWTNENLESVVDALNELIPAMGSVKNINKNRCLERFRTAQNVVHDIFNNGLGNRGKQLKVLNLKSMTFHFLSIMEATVTILVIGIGLKKLLSLEWKRLY